MHLDWLDQARLVSAGLSWNELSRNGPAGLGYNWNGLNQAALGWVYGV